MPGMEIIISMLVLAVMLDIAAMYHHLHVNVARAQMRTREGGVVDNKIK